MNWSWGPYLLIPDHKWPGVRNRTRGNPQDQGDGTLLIELSIGEDATHPRWAIAVAPQRTHREQRRAQLGKRMAPMTVAELQALAARLRRKPPLSPGPVDVTGLTLATEIRAAILVQYLPLPTPE